MGDGHPSGAPVARRLERPHPGTGTSSPWSASGAPRPCSALLRAGFTWPAGHPAAGGLLPHHFTVAPARRAVAVSFLWHSPSGHPDWALPSALLCGARTFLERRTARGRPAGLHDGVLRLRRKGALPAASPLRPRGRRPSREQRGSAAPLVPRPTRAKTQRARSARRPGLRPWRGRASASHERQRERCLWRERGRRSLPRVKTASDKGLSHPSPVSSPNDPYICSR